METVKFEAITVRDALKKVKAELGQDAVIISTREKSKVMAEGGSPQKVVEVLASAAATASTASKDVQKPRQNLSNQQIYKPNFPVINNKDKATVLKSSTNSTLPLVSERTSETQAGGNSSGRPAGQTNLPKGADSDRVLQEVQDQLGNLRTELRRLPHVNLGEQMQEIKVLLHDIMRGQTASTPAKHVNPHIDNIAVKLRSAGVLNSVTADLCQYLESHPAPEGADQREHFLSHTIRYIMKKIQISGPFSADSNLQETHCLVGPTGIGKTTTIAKIAAQLKIKKQRQVALLSMDSLRVSAADQLRVYSKILDTPFAEPRDTKELLDFVEKRYDLDTILLDTAGRTAHSVTQSDFLKSLKHSSIPIRFHLVLSATMKQRDLEETVRAYEFLNPTSLIFTKLDESWSFGEIFNICALFQTPVSYFAVGQNVPDDLEIATKERVVERLLKI